MESTGINELDRIHVKSQQYEDNIAIFSIIINHKMYKLNKNKLYYKSDQVTTSVQRLNLTSE